MAITTAHIARAEDNERFYALTLTWDTGRYLHWSVTSLFYSALHYVDACLHEHKTIADPKGGDPSDHVSRNTTLRRNFPRIYQDYRTLQDSSEDARYRLVAFTEQQVRELQSREFAAIKTFARRRLGLSP